MQVESTTHDNNGTSDGGNLEAIDPNLEVHTARARALETGTSGSEIDELSPAPGTSTHSPSEVSATVKKPIDIVKSWHEGLQYKSWDDWDLPTTLTNEELQAQRDAIGKRYGFCPRRGMHKNNEPSRIPIRYMYLFGSYPSDDAFSVTQCRHCSHICKSEYFSTHLEQDCVKRPLETESDEEYEPETNYGEDEECEEGEREDASPASSGGSESETEQQVHSRSASSHSNRSRSRSASPSARSRSSSSESHSGSPSEVEDGEEEEAHYQRSRSHSGSRSRSRSRSVSGSDQEEEDSPRSRSPQSYASRSRSASPASSAEPEDEYREGEDSDNEETHQEEYESVEQGEGEGYEEYEEGSPEECVYNESDYEILPHLNASPQDSDLDLKDLEQYLGCQVVSPSNSTSSIHSPHVSEKGEGEPYHLEEEQVQFQLLGGLPGARGSEADFEAVGTPVDPLELEPISADERCQSMESPNQSPSSSSAFSSTETPSLTTKLAKKKKKKLKDEPRKVIPLKDRRFNPDEHCGVINAEGVPCTRSLTCKSHSMASRRAVQERSQSFDILLASHKKARDEAKAAKTGIVDIGDENDTAPSFNSHGQKPAEETTRVSWTSPNSVMLALANMLRECAASGPRTPQGNSSNFKINATQVPGRKGGNGSKFASLKTERFPQVIPEENLLDGSGSAEETVLDPALYGNQSHLLSNPLDDSDEEVNESDWEWVPLIKIKDLSLEDADVQPQQMQFNSTPAFPGASQVMYTDPSRALQQSTAREAIEAHMGEIVLQSRTSKTGFGVLNPRKRPLSPSNNLVPLQQTPIKKSRTDVTTLESLLSPQSTLSSLATQLPNPTKSSTGSRPLPAETFPNPSTTPEVSLKDFQSLQLVSSSDSPPISLASLLGIRPQVKQEGLKLNSNSTVQPGLIIPNQTQVQRTIANISGRSQPRKQQFPTVKPGSLPARTGSTATAALSKVQQTQPVTVKLPGKIGGSSPAICLVNPEQQFQQQTQFGQYELHLPEAFSGGNGTAGSDSVVGTSSSSTVPISQMTENPQQLQTGTTQSTIRQHLQHLQLKQTMTAYVKQEPGSGSPLQQRGSSASSTSQFSDYTLQIQEQSPASTGNGENSWAALSQGTAQQRQEDDAPVADSELSKLLAAQFEFED